MIIVQNRNIHYETATTSVVFELTGIPTEELGLPAGDFDISITDSVTDLYEWRSRTLLHGRCNATA